MTPNFGIILFEYTGQVTRPKNRYAKMFPKKCKDKPKNLTSVTWMLFL